MWCKELTHWERLKAGAKGDLVDEMIGWHHQLSWHVLEYAPGVGNGQGSLACCCSWGHKESDTTERLNWTELNWMTLRHMNHGLMLHLSFPLFWLVSGNLGRWVWACTLRVYKVFTKNWSGSLAKRRLCLGPVSVIDCTPLSALSFWVSLFPRMRGYNSGTEGQEWGDVCILIADSLCW